MGGRAIFGLLTLLLCTPVLATWHEASTEKFTVYSDGSDKTLVEFTEWVERFDQVLRVMTGYEGPPSPVRFRIYLVDDADVVRDLDPAHTTGVAGFYRAVLSGAIGVVGRGYLEIRLDPRLNGKMILCHEYTHHFMAQYFPAAYPRWYQEGMAEFFSTARLDGHGNAQIGAPTVRMWGLFGAGWIGTGELMQDKTSDKDRDAFYAQSWLLIHYLFDHPERRTQMHEYLALRNRGVSHGESMQKAFGSGDSEFDQELRKYLRQRTVGEIVLDQLKFVTPQVSVRELPPSADALLLADLKLELGRKEDEGQTILGQVRVNAARFRDDEDARLTLARAEATFGDHEKARSLFESLARGSPPNRRALLGLAKLTMADASTGDAGAQLAAARIARKFAVRANALAPNDPEALFVFYSTFRLEPTGPTQNAIAGLEQAYLDLPQHETLAVSYANELMRSHDTAQAAVILRRIAYAPHGGDAAKWAQAQLRRIESTQR